jgi:hypothetical protein
MEPWNRRIIDEKYHYLRNSPSDINEHLPTFRRYAKECNTITELGTRWIVGTWGFLMGLSDPARSNWHDHPLNKKLISIDIDHPEIHGSNLNEVYVGAKQWDINFEFRQQNTLENEIEECDFLFLDTWHSYDQVKGELIRHADKAKKYIGFHDTEYYGFKDMSGTQGIWPAIEEFLHSNRNWYVYEKFANNQGVTILKRKY